MLNERLKIAQTFAAAFLPAKRANAEAVKASFTTVAVAVEQQFAAKLDTGESDEILELLREQANLQFDSLIKLHQAHKKIGAIRRLWQIPPAAFGSEDTPDYLKPAGQTAQLSIVA